MGFEVIGKIKGKGRPKWSSKTPSMYTPVSTRAYEDYIKDCYINQSGKLLEGAIRVNINMLFAIPKSMKKADKELCKYNEMLPDKKPDADNCAKVVLDALNRVAYGDDKQVVELSVVKRWTTGEERLEIEISQID